MGTTGVEITEHDDAGNVTATYVQSALATSKESRIDVIRPRETKSLWQQTLDIFLPAGYPHSVTDDYLEYQIYDSLQAFTSSIASLLSSRAVLSSVGVGDSTATPTSALLLSVFQESTGRLATIAFAHRFGTALEPECKMYRLLADVLNDFAFVLDCLSPVFPKGVRVGILAGASVLRALCGVAAGSAKASLSAHFAREGNLGELNAKDASQETVISLVGMLVGTVVVSWVTGTFATWSLLVGLLAVHLETNRRAVRAVRMRTLSRQRARLVWHCLEREVVPSLEMISGQEKIFERGSVLRDAQGVKLGHCELGVSTEVLLRCFAPRHQTTSSTALETEAFREMIKTCEDRKFLVASQGDSKNGQLQVFVVFKNGTITRDVLEAYWTALALADRRTSEKVKQDYRKEVQILETALEKSRAVLTKYEADLKAQEWDLEIDALETRSKIRIDVKAS